MEAEWFRVQGQGVDRPHLCMLRLRVRGQLLPCVRPEDRPATYHLGRRARERARPLGHGHTLHALLHLATDAATGLPHCRLHQRKAAGEFSASQDVVFRHRHHPAD